MNASRLATLERGVWPREKQKAALASVLAALLLVTLKLVVGVATRSLGILSEAAHSGLDLVAATVTLVSVRVADKPADPSHPFGHGKVEHLSGFIEAALLMLTCAWIVVEAGRRLFFLEVHVEPSLWAFGVMFILLTLDTFRRRAGVRRLAPDSPEQYFPRARASCDERGRSQCPQRLSHRGRGDPRLASDPGLAGLGGEGARGRPSFKLPGPRRPGARVQGQDQRQHGPGTRSRADAQGGSRRGFTLGGPNQGRGPGGLGRQYP